MNRAKLLCLAAGLLLAVGAAGCADPGRDEGGSGQGGGAAAPSTAAPTTTPPTTPPTARPAGSVTVTGTVSRGVEPGCLLLDAGGARYLLVGGERAELRPGRRLAVTGRVDRSLLSTCQQGEPLVVSSIEPAG